MKKNQRTIAILITAAGVCVVFAYYAYSYMFGERNYRAQGPDRGAVAELHTARICAEAFYSDNKRYPDSLEEMRRKPGECRGNPDFSLAYERAVQESYMITSSPRKGKKAFLLRSEDPAISWRGKDDSDAIRKLL